MRVLALITDAHAGQGGIQRYNLHFFRALSSSDGETSVVAVPRNPETNGTPLLSKVTWKKPPSGKLGYALNVFKTLWTDGPFDFIFCSHLHLAPLAAILSRLTGIPFWLQIYGLEAWHVSKTSLKEAVKQATLITSISRYTRRRFLSWSGLDPEKVRVLPATVDNRFQPGPKPDYLLRRYGLTGKKVLLTLSRLSSRERYKGQDRVIRLMPQLLQVHPDLVYVIAGEGDDRFRLEIAARTEGLNGSVRFIGYVDELELVDLYRMADLFVMPSTGEGFGTVFLEAAACGIPVIGGGTEGSFDALLEGKIGCLVEPNDLEELRQAILKGLESRDSRLDQVERFSNLNFRRFVEALIKERIAVKGNRSLHREQKSLERPAPK